ncbi:hypothetical protein [Lentilactobacillus kosonis]|uniref:Uncharacterized protein n=1 Tax=Lentilactobacillus kosonis TaxID=2810561 RepID=A0A401FIC5_9LACO|nr:hypothetical protein [Lentilactobacillus kosonis]GAY72048.1 hypothetical protein NBRC111893_194 [Lentilactobacillus kosonis]
MKKLILWGTVVLGMFGILMTSTTTVNAATWHHGVPKFLKSGFWTLNKQKKITLSSVTRQFITFTKMRENWME